MNDPCRLVDEVKAIAADAGRRILQIYNRSFTVAEKDDGSPLTEADRAAHDLIVTRLRALTPDIPVLSEESTEIDYAHRAGWQRLWLVDPLDGTKEFIKHNGEFTVNIALIDDRRPVLGVVLAPALNVVYTGCEGGGAFKRVPGEAAEAIHVRRYRGGKATVAASRSHAGPKLTGFLQRLAQAQGQPQVISMGSALKICLVAEGAADVYPRLGPTSEWDTAAADCVLRAAGGKLTDVHKQPLRYNKACALNPWFLASGGGDYDWTRHLDEP